MKRVKKRKIQIQKRVEITERVPSGVAGFDKMTEGGFEKNSVNLVVGDSGSGKTIFALQFLVEGLKKGENCLYITFEEKKEEFYKNMMNFGWDMAEYEKKGKFYFLEYHPEKVKVMIEEGGGEIENVVVKKNISRLVIDSVTSFALLFEDELQKREAALSLFNIIRKWDCTSILTLQESPLYRKEGESTSLEFEADSIILIYFIREKKERQRFIEVLKMRGTKHSNKIHTLKFSDKGLYVSEEILSGSIS
jgi:circadian clock protein KaiC